MEKTIIAGVAAFFIVGGRGGCAKQQRPEQHELGKFGFGGYAIQ
jgi:hypothetical protein